MIAYLGAPNCVLQLQNEITIRQVRNAVNRQNNCMSGNINKTERIKLINACNDSNQDEILKIINSIISEGKEIDKITSDIIGFLRDLLLYKTGFGSKAIYNNPDFQKLSIIKKGIIYAWLEELNKVQQNIKFTNQKRTYLELGLLKMGDKDLNDYNDLISNVKTWESRLNILESKKFVTEAPNQSIHKEEIKKEPIIKPFVMEPIKEEIKDISHEAGEVIDINDILRILNNGDKEYKQVLRDALSVSESKNPDSQIFKLMGNYLITAASNNEAIIVLESTPLCNRLMRDENYNELISLIKNEGAQIKDFYALPREVFNKITKEFMASRNNPDYKPNWDVIDIQVNKHKVYVKEKDRMDILKEELFDGLNVEDITEGE